MSTPLSASTACTRCSRGEVTHEQAREAGAEQSAALSQSRLSAVPRRAQWEPSRQTTLSLPDLQDLLWDNARHADVRVEDSSRGGGPSAMAQIFFLFHAGSSFVLSHSPCLAKKREKSHASFRPCSRWICTPRFQTATMLRVARMSCVGSPSTNTRSA